MNKKKYRLCDNELLNRLYEDVWQNARELFYLPEDPIELYLIDEPLKTLGGCMLCDGKPIWIQINKHLIEIGDEKLILEVLVHEIAHAVVNFYQDGVIGHTKQWRYIGERIAEKYGVDVQRLCFSQKVKDFSQANSKYLLECDNCGKKVARNRMCDVIRLGDGAKCTCGGTWHRVR